MEDKWEQYKKDNCSDFDGVIEQLHKDHPEQMEEARIWVKQFMDEQESLGYEFNKLIEDNYWELLLE